MENDGFPVRELGPDEFPALLKEILDPPTTLYVRGTLAPEEHRILAVVGSRECSPYGRQAAEMLVRGLRGYPISIVSGLAIGIDGIAHAAALEVGLHAIAVPGSGIADTVLYPMRNRYIARNILAAGGALMNEFLPDAHATTWSFPARNRIMAGMSHATLIIEAGEKSGTLITARLAMEYNRDVLAVPGNVFSKGSVGTHALIRDGAVPIRTSGDILEALGLRPNSNEVDTMMLLQ